MDDLDPDDDNRHLSVMYFNPLITFFYYTVEVLPANQVSMAWGVVVAISMRVTRCQLISHFFKRTFPRLSASSLDYDVCYGSQSTTAQMNSYSVIRKVHEECVNNTCHPKGENSILQLKAATSGLCCSGVQEISLDALLALDGVGELGVWLSVGVSSDQATNGLAEELEVINWVVTLDSLVEVGVESHLLDVLGVAQFNESLSCTVVNVEDLLESIEHGVSWSVQAIILLDVGVFDLRLARKTGSSLHELNNFLSCHASRLGSEVDALTGTLGDVSSSITDKGDTTLNTTRAVVFWDRVGLDLDDLSSLNLVTGAVADGLLVLLDSRSVDDGSGSNTDVVVLGEDPTVEIWRDIVTDVHLSHFFIELHLLVRDLDAFLECDGEIVGSSIHGFGNARVRAISTNNQINVHRFRHASRGTLLVFLVVDGVLVLRDLVVSRDVNAGNKTVDDLGTSCDSTVAEVFVENLTTAHTDVFVGLEGLTNVDLDTSWGDQIHLTNLCEEEMNQ